MEKTDILSLPYDELIEYVQNRGEKAFRGKQLYQWMHQHLAESFDAMQNLPKSFKEGLDRDCNYHILKSVDLQISQLDGTRKYLFELADGNMGKHCAAKLSPWMTDRRQSTVQDIQEHFGPEATEAPDEVVTEAEGSAT